LEETIKADEFYKKLDKSTLIEIEKILGNIPKGD
jgi:hypothetical protein